MSFGPRALARYTALWLGIAIVCTAQNIAVYFYVARFGSRPVSLPSTLADWLTTLGSVGTDWLLWAFFAPAAIWLARRVRIGRGSIVGPLALHLVAGSLVVVAMLGVRAWIGAHVPALPSQPWPGILYSLPLNYVMYWAIVGVSHATDYYGRYRERELAAAQLESRLAQAQLHVLQSQLQPHFLFNTLHTISVLVREQETEAADRVLARLSDLLRWSLDAGAEQEVPLARELESLDLYLEIQKTRFQDRLKVRVEVPPELRNVRVPSLLLQPLVENAIRHGVSHRAEGGEIAVRAESANNRLRIVVEDDGPGLSSGGHGREGLGLGNTRARLRQLYGDRQRLLLSNRPQGGLQVLVECPLVPRPTPLA